MSESALFISSWRSSRLSVVCSSTERRAPDVGADAADVIQRTVQLLQDAVDAVCEQGGSASVVLLLQHAHELAER